MATSQEERPSRMAWPPLLIVAALAAAVLLGRFYPLAWPGRSDLPAQLIGYGLGATGALLTGWGFFTLNRADTTVLPHKPVKRLVTHGAFGFRRNPIYMGEVLIFLGLAQATGNIWMALMAPPLAILLFALAILPEERHLEARFGEEYLAYKARTRRWF
ncbi:MAG TPA: isoprenylcysteine carboxylmethyltransferase family protein [Hyphomicrobiaceae bacterium]|nr:isoprenylcysteine carboxylmethyltransferase family protein [Hyphomicrobiaceae bacterium]